MKYVFLSFVLPFGGILSTAVSAAAPNIHVAPCQAVVEFDARDISRTDALQAVATAMGIEILGFAPDSTSISIHLRGGRDEILAAVIGHSNWIQQHERAADCAQPVLARLWLLERGERSERVEIAPAEPSDVASIITPGFNDAKHNWTNPKRIEHDRARGKADSRAEKRTRDEKK